MTEGERIGPRTAALILAAIVAGASGLALRWVFLVPVFQAPDEPRHFDYAMALRDGGFRKAVPFDPRALNCAHPWTRYLVDSTDSDTVIFNQTAKVAPDYGTRAYFRAIDRGAPPLGEVRITRPPDLAAVYPYGYYLSLAGWLKFVGLFTGRVTVIFFAARIFSVMLLACSLVFCYLSARELRIGRGTALTATAIIGFFPLTTFLASYIQSDNLAFTLVSVGLYQALRTARRGGRVVDLATLGLTWGFLLATKPHYFVCLVGASLPLLASRIRPRRWPLAAVLLAASSPLLWSVHAWVVRESGSYYSAPVPMAYPVYTTLERLGKALNDYFRLTTHLSFWGVFGWLDAPLELAAPPTLFPTIRYLAMGGTWVVLALTLVRMERVASRLVRLAARGRRWAALRIVASDPVFNTFALFYGLMIYAYIRFDNLFGAQGRNWLPLMLPIILTAIRYAPRGLTLRGSRRAAAALATGGLLAYVAVGSYYGVRAIEKRYYMPTRHYVLDEARLPAEPTEVRGLTWSGREGDSQGAGASLSYKLARASRVRFLELRYRMDNPDHARADLHVAWSNSRTPGPAAETKQLLSLPVGPGEHTVRVWVNADVDTVRIEPDRRPCHFAVESLSLHNAVRRVASRDGLHK